MKDFTNNGSIFTSVPKKKQRRSNFNLSHDVKLSLDMGLLVPCMIMDTVPGDHIKINSTSMLRMAPLVAPVMHKIDVILEYFFCPNRILWGGWETFITGSLNGKPTNQGNQPAFPVVEPYNDVKFLNGNGTLMDYFGLPLKSQFDVPPLNDTKVSAIPFAAYQRIYDEYYRDENLIESMYTVESGFFENYNQLYDGTQATDAQQQLGAIRPRCWEHDYFTSALPWAQKGEEVTIPIDMEYDIDGALPYLKVADNATLADNNLTSAALTAPFDDRARIIVPLDSGGGANAHLDNTGAMYNTTTINDLRAAIKLQEWLETNARGGSRYFESIYAHFGVKSPDSRLQRPEFIGSNRSSMVISEIFQTSSPQASTDTPQGNMSGNASNVHGTRDFNYYCQEHGYIIGILSVIPKTAYMHGVPKHFNKIYDKLDFYFPEFAHLGEQEIQNLEIFAGFDDGYDPNGTFGYIPRYSEYKYMNSRVAGDFRETLKYWHLARDFETGPNLNDTFVASGDTISKRIFAVQNLPQDSTGEDEPLRDYHSIYAHVFHDIKASRLMPKYGTPTI